MAKKKPSPLNIFVHLLALYPLGKLLFDYFTNNFSPNPIQDIEQDTGFAAVTLLLFSLATTPLRILFNWKEPGKYRRVLGLYAFLYATLHVIAYVALDYGFNLPLLIENTFEKRYTLVGSLAFLLLIPLAITSYKWGMKKIGKNWKTLHKTVYLIAPLVIIHFAWARKGDIFSLQGDVLQPFLYGVILIFLLILRISGIRKFFGGLHS